MLFQSLRTLCLAPGGPGSIWNYLGEPVRSTRGPKRFACGFHTGFHFVDVAKHLNRPVKVISASLVLVSYTPLPIRILRRWREPMKMKQ
jgi:hypothetical protein